MHPEEPRAYLPRVATYETSILVPCAIQDTFAIVSDFRNAAKWDPRTYLVEKTTPDPIGVGTVFRLHGGMVSKSSLLARLPIPRSLLARPLPYEVTEFDPPNRLVLAGESRFLRYRDVITFTAEGQATRLNYAAELTLKGPLAIGEPALRLMFKRIGDDATRDIAATVVQGVRSL